MNSVFAVFPAILLLIPFCGSRAEEPFASGEWVWCGIETNYVAAPHGICPALDGETPVFCPVCQEFHRPETPERPHVHIGQTTVEAGTGGKKPDDEPDETTPSPGAGPDGGETDEPGNQPGGQGSPADRGPAVVPVAGAAVAATLALIVAAGLARRFTKRGNRSAPVRPRRIPWRWKNGVPQGLELLPGSLVCQPASGLDGGTAMVYDAMFLDEDGWVPAIVKKIVGKGMKQIDRFPVLRFETSVLETLAGVDAIPRLLAGPVQDAPVGAERWSFYAMTPATGRPWPDRGGLGRDTRLALHALCEALEQMHERGIGHHDLKPQNAFWNQKTKTVTLIDFGSAVFHGGGPSNPIGSTYPKSEPWVAPAGDGKCLALLSTASDVWVYGLMFCEAFAGGVADRSRWPENPEDREWFRQKLVSRTTPSVADAVVDGLLAIAPVKRKSLRDFRAILEKEWDL